MKSNRYQPAAGQLSREQQQVVVKHLDIATAISKRYAPLGQKKSLEQGDLFQEASLGLCLAVLTLQTSDEQQFRKDATKWCMNYVGMAINHERDLDECVDLFYNPPDMALTPGETEEERKSNLAWRERRAERVERMMSVLDPKERQVINMLFGFDGEVLEFHEIAKQLKLSQPRVHQIFEKAKAKMGLIQVNNIH